MMLRAAWTSAILYGDRPVTGLDSSPLQGAFPSRRPTQHVCERGTLGGHLGSELAENRPAAAGRMNLFCGRRSSGSVPKLARARASSPRSSRHRRCLRRWRQEWVHGAARDMAAVLPNSQISAFGGSTHRPVAPDVGCASRHCRPVARRLAVYKILG